MNAFLCVVLFLTTTVVGQELFPLAIIHVNDFHAKFEETDMATNLCKPGKQCIGGYARMVTKVKELLNKHSDKHTLYLNAGDNFSGSLWYSLFRHNVTSELLNAFPADCMTLGNHEFDHGIDGVLPFLDDIRSPMVVANIDDSLEPSMQGKYEKSMVLERGGRKIGIIGVILTSTESMASTGKLKFLDETESVKVEAEKLNAEGVEIIIVLSHSGLGIDEYMAANVGPYVDLIVGAHSHTFLYSGNNPPGPDRPYKEYPVVVTQESGHRIPIVQASAYAKYVGEFVVYFDDEGNLINFEGNPVFLDSTVVPDPEIIAAMAPWKVEADKIGWENLGTLLKDLSQSSCSRNECPLANLITDSYLKVAIRKNTGPGWTSAEISFINSGGIRSGFEKGILYYADVVGVMPFENELIIITVRGDRLLQAMESSISSGVSLHQSGMKIIANMSAPRNERIVDLKVRCRECRIPVYEPLHLLKDYKVIAPDYVVYSVFESSGRDHIDMDIIDANAFAQYIRESSPIFPSNDGRWVFV